MEKKLQTLDNSKWLFEVNIYPVCKPGQGKLVLEERFIWSRKRDLFSKIAILH